MDDQPQTVPELADRIGVDPKRVRAWLRRQGWRTPGEHGMRWELAAEQVRQVEERFSPR